MSKNTKHVVRDLVLQTTLGGDTREATSHIPIQCGESFYATPFDCLGLLGRHERVPEEEQGPNRFAQNVLGYANADRIRGTQAGIAWYSWIS